LLEEKMPNLSKIHPDLAEQLTPQVAEATVESLAPLDIIVQYRPGAMRAVAQTDGVVETKRTFQLISASSHRASRGAIYALSDRADVEMIWHDAPVHTLLDVSVPLINAPQVWQAGFTGKGIKVGIVDTGIDPDHIDFAGRIAQMKDFTGEGASDNNGHGTHVAGIIGGSGAASGGKYRGVAYECTYYTAKVLRGDGSGSTSDVIAGIEWAVQQGVQVINLSLGSDGACDGTDASSVACDAAVSKGVVMCIAAGNAGPSASTVGSPGCAKTVITIGATSKTDQTASFSSRGPTSDGRVKPDVCFPGVNIVACRAKGTSMGTPVNDSYTSASGTSMATPHATGTCALILQAKPGLAPQQVKDLLMSTARNLGLDANTQGKGRADAFAAYQAAIGVTPQPPPTPAPAPLPGQGQGCLEAVKSAILGR